jgi:hypothetical protein
MENTLANFGMGRIFADRLGIKSDNSKAHKCIEIFLKLL